MRGDFEHPSTPFPDQYEPVVMEYYTPEKREMQTLYVHRPRSVSGKVPVVIFFHGGGMTSGGRECPDSVFNGVNVVIEPRYRLSPADPAPAQILDAAAAIGWTLDHMGALGGDASKVFVGGMSAGAYLAAIAVLNPEFLRPYGYGKHDVAGLVLISGQMTTHFQVKADLGYGRLGCDPVIDELAPLGHLSADVPPMLLVTGEAGRDMPARPEENAFMAASLRALGAPHVECYALPGHCHGGAFDSCCYLVEQFINRVLEGGRP